MAPAAGPTTAVAPPRPVAASASTRRLASTGGRSVPCPRAAGRAPVRSRVTADPTPVGPAAPSGVVTSAVAPVNGADREVARPSPAPTLPADDVPVPAARKADAPLLVDTSPGGCATGECLPETPARRRAAGTTRRAPSSTAGGPRWTPWPASRPGTRRRLKQARLLSLREGEVGVAFRADASFHRTTVTGQSGRAGGRAPPLRPLRPRPPAWWSTRLAGAAAGGKSVAEIDAEARAEHERATGQSVRNHPAILATLRILGGELEHIQVLEHERTGAPGSDVIDEQP